MRNPFRCSTTTASSAGASLPLLEHLGKDFERLHEPRPRPVEVLIAVGDDDRSFAYGAECLPFRAVLQQVPIAQRVVDAKPAGADDDQIGIGCAELFPCHPRRMLS